MMLLGGAVSGRFWLAKLVNTPLVKPASTVPLTEKIAPEYDWPLNVNDGRLNHGKKSSVHWEDH